MLCHRPYRLLQPILKDNFMEFRPPPPPHTNGFPISTLAVAQKDPWGRPGSTEKLSYGPERPTNLLLYASQPRVPSPHHHQIGHAAC